MAERPKTENPHGPRPERPRAPLPIGYRQGIITAITVLLGFSLLFVRYAIGTLSCPEPGVFPRQPQPS
jgi:hypothetical protein